MLCQFCITEFMIKIVYLFNCFVLTFKFAEVYLINQKNNTEIIFYKKQNIEQQNKNNRCLGA